MYSYFFYFGITTLIINLTPGPAMMYCINSSLTHGKKSGVFAAIGVEIGTLFYVLITGLGLSAIILSSPLLYSGLRGVGVLYLLYLAYNALPLRKRVPNISPTNQKRKTASHTLMGGVILNITNPKIILFFLTLLPQFVPSKYHDIKLFFILGLYFTFSGLIVNVLAALFAHNLKIKSNMNAQLGKIMKCVPSMMFAIIAIVTIASIIGLL